MGVGAILGIAGAAIAAGSTAYAAKSASDSADAARKANAANVAATNKLNLSQFGLARGSGGNAIMPWYLNDSSGKPFESNTLGPSLIDSFNRTGGTNPSDFKAVTDRFMPAKSGAEGAVNDIFSGGTTNKLLNNQAPVGAARVATTRESAIKALNDNLNQIDAMQAKRGFQGGDSFGSRLLRYQASRDASQAVAGAGMQNLTDVKNIKDYGDVALPLQNLQTPYSMEGQALNSFTLPQSAYLDLLGKRLSPLNFLNIHTSAPFQYQPLPTVAPIAGTGQLVGSAVGSGANMLLDQYLKKQAANRYYAAMQQSPGMAQQYVTPNAAEAAAARLNAAYNDPNFDPNTTPGIDPNLAGDSGVDFSNLG